MLPSFQKEAQLTSFIYAKVILTLFFCLQKGLVDFYKNGVRKQDKANNWGSVVLGGALGALALGALIINRA